MTIDTITARRRSLNALMLAAAASLVLVGCSSPATAPSTDTTTATVESESESSTGGVSTELPADFPQDVFFITDGDVVAASGAAPRWELTKTVQLLDQVSAVVTFNERSYSFTIDEFVDGDSPSWVISNDSYTMSIDVEDGDPILVTYVIEEN